MNLRSKTILILCATTLLATALVAAAWFSFFVRYVSSIEEAEMRATFARTVSLLDDDIEQLELLTADWAVWDDSYRYAATADPAYAASNFAGDATFVNLGLSGFAFIGAGGRVLYSYNSDEIFSGGEVAAIARGVAGGGGRRGLAVLGNGLHLAVALPVVRSDGSGEPRGAIVMTRALDRKRLDRYGRLTGAAVSLGSPPRGAVAGNGVTVARSRKGHSAEGLLRDLSGAPAATLVVESEGALYPRSPAGALLVASVVLVGGAIGLGSLLLLERGVFRRIRAVMDGLGAITTERDPDARLEITGNDEFTDMERVMNRTLDALGTVINQRDATLREVHHRVKNNLQVIASLLSLQAGEVRSSEASAALLDVRRRVLSMALAHDELYIDPDLGSVEAERFLERLARAVEPRIELAAPIEVSADEAGGEGREPVYIDAWRAVPVGIIASEAVTALSGGVKAGDRALRVRLSARPLGADGFLIEILGESARGALSDAFFPDDFGLRLARVLAEQIGGTVDCYRSDSAISFLLRVPPSARPPAAYPPA